MTPRHGGPIRIHIAAARTQARATQVFSEVIVSNPVPNPARVTQVFAEVVVKQ